MYIYIYIYIYVYTHIYNIYIYIYIYIYIITNVFSIQLAAATDHFKDSFIKQSKNKERRKKKNKQIQLPLSGSATLHNHFPPSFHLHSSRLLFHSPRFLFFPRLKNLKLGVFIINPNLTLGYLLKREYRKEKINKIFTVFIHLKYA